MLSAPPSLVEKSPFIPPDFEAPSATAPTPTEIGPGGINDLSFHGVFQIAGQYRFNIHDRHAGRGFWVSENDDTNGFRITGYDRQNRTITVVSHQGTGVLTLESPSETPVVTSSTPQTRPAGDRRVVVPPRRVTRPPPPAGASGPSRRTPPPPPQRQSD